MKASLFFLFGVLLTIAITQWDGFLAILSIAAPYLLGSLLIFLVLGTVIWLFRRPLGRWAAQKIGGKVEAVYNVAVDKERSTDSKLASVGFEYLNREQLRFLLFFWLGTAGAVVGTFNIYLLYDQNKLIRDQTGQLIEQNKDVKEQTAELKAQNKVNREQWANERQASLLKIIYDETCVFKKVDATEKKECQPVANSRARNEAIKSYITLRRQIDKSGEIDLSKVNAEQLSLSGLNLEKVYFLSANLKGANLGGANLTGANLRGANLTGANLRGANSRKADLRVADLSGVGLRGADLRLADLRLADLRGADLSGADLRGADLRLADLRGADLRGIDLRLADLRGANLSEADLREADLRGADLSGANLGGANLGGANVGGANLKWAKFLCSTIKKAKHWQKAKGVDRCLPDKQPAKPSP